MICILDRPRCTLRHEAGLLRIDCEGEPAQRVPIRQLELVVVYGTALAETGLWRVLANAGVPAVLLPTRGPDGAAVLGNGLATQLPLRRLQHRLADCPDAALAMARWPVRFKLKGYDLPLGTLRERHGAGVEPCAVFIDRRDRALGTLDAAAGIDVVRGIEGQVASAWFALLAATLDARWGFKARNRRPPRDPVNALLSLGYTLVGAEVQRAVCAAGLDPSLGFLHQPFPGREAMVLDLLEVFRGGVDDMMLRWIAPDGPDQADFYYRDAEGCRLSKTARPRFFKAWTRRREQWPRPLRTGNAPDWGQGGLREQSLGWIERLRAEMKRVGGSDEAAEAVGEAPAADDDDGAPSQDADA